eukprot:2528319-Pyramimonas_sp.AAC.1
MYNARVVALCATCKSAAQALTLLVYAWHRHEHGASTSAGGVGEHCLCVHDTSLSMAREGPRAASHASHARSALGGCMNAGR